MSDDGGGYVTRGRAREIELHVASVEARMQERVDQLERELAEVRAGQAAFFRSLLDGLVEQVKRHTSAAPTGRKPQ